MSDAVMEAERAYYETRAACYAVILDPASTQAERRAATRRRQNAYAAYAASVLNDFFSRANMLEDLIEQLNALSTEITGSQAVEAVNMVTTAISTVTTILQADENANG